LDFFKNAIGGIVHTCDGDSVIRAFDFDATDGGFLCNANMYTCDYTSHMGTIWKGKVRQLCLRTC
jgi:hypothetical protein